VRPYLVDAADSRRAARASLAGQLADVPPRPAADAFDDAWVLTPTSIDVVYNSFTKLLGWQTSNKNDVIQNVSWKFTGNRNQQCVVALPFSLAFLARRRASDNGGLD